MVCSAIARLVCVLLISLPLLAQDLQDPDPGRRARAVRELASQGSVAIPQIGTMLKDPALEVRLEAVKAIVEIDTQHSLDPLMEATRDNDSEIQIRATDGLVNFYMPGYVRTGLTASIRRVGSRITASFTNVDDQVIDPFIKVRPEVIEALGKLARGGISMEARANAARAVGILRGKAAVPDLVEALRTTDTQVIFETLTAFQKIGDQSVAPRIAFLLRDPEKKVQIKALETEGLLLNREALPALREALNRAQDNDVRKAALTAIAMLPDKLNRPIYAKFLNDRNEGLRGAAAEGFGRLRDPSDLPLLEKSFSEESKSSPRLSLAFALVMQGRTEREEFSPLQYLINTLNSRVRQGEARALLIEVARVQSVREALHESLGTATDEEKIFLAQILARSGDEQTIRYLETLSRDQDTEVADEALRALRSLKARLP